MTDVELKRAEELAENHATYMKQLFEAHEEPEDVQRMLIFHYKSAFIHGYKHGIEDSND